MTAEIVFHIGLEKTGTTAFQRFCAANRGPLARQGVLYPRSLARRRPDHAAFAASYLADAVPDPSIVRRAPPRALAVRDMRREIGRSGARRVLVSAEHLSSRFDRRRAAALARDFADHGLAVVVAVRDLHARFVSAYGTAIVSGGRLSLDAYADEVLDPSNPYLDIAATLDPWREAFGAGRVAVVDYDAAPDIVPALLGACGVEGMSMPEMPAPREKAALPPEALRVLRLCNVILHERQGSPAARPFAVWAQHTFFSNACRRALARSVPAGAGAPWVVSARTLARLDRAAAAECAWLRRHYGLDPRGAGARERLAVGREDAQDARHLAQARDLVGRSAGPLWSIGQALVAASRVASRRR